MKNSILTFITVLIVANMQAQVYNNQAQQLAVPATQFKALSGLHGGLQTSLAYQNRWPNTTVNGVDYLMNADGFVPKINTAFGVTAAHERNLNGTFQRNVIEAYCSPKYKLKNEMILMPTISLAFNQQSIDFNRLNSFNPNGLTPIKNNVNTLGIGAGFGFLFHDWIGAVEISSLNQPDVPFFEEIESRRLRRYSAIVGKQFQVNDFSFIPTLSYQREGTFQYVRGSLTAQYKSIIFGTSFQWDDSFGGAIGVNLKKIARLSYSYNYYNGFRWSGYFDSHQIVLSIFSFTKKGEKAVYKSSFLM